MLLVLVLGSMHVTGWELSRKIVMSGRVILGWYTDAGKGEWTMLCDDEEAGWYVRGRSSSLNSDLYCMLATNNLPPPASAPTYSRSHSMLVNLPFVSVFIAAGIRLTQQVQQRPLIWCRLSAVPFWRPMLIIVDWCIRAVCVTGITSCVPASV